MKKITNMMGDFTMSVMNAEAVGFASIEKNYDLVADRTYHREVAPAAAPAVHI